MDILINEWNSGALAGQRLAIAAAKGLGDDLQALDALLQAVKLATLTERGRIQFCAECVATLHFLRMTRAGE